MRKLFFFLLFIIIFIFSLYISLYNVPKPKIISKIDIIKEMTDLEIPSGNIDTSEIKITKKDGKYYINDICCISEKEMEYFIKYNYIELSNDPGNPTVISPDELHTILNILKYMHAEKYKVQGTIISWNAGVNSGTFSIKTDDGRIMNYLFWSGSWGHPTIIGSYKDVLKNYRCYEPDSYDFAEKIEEKPFPDEKLYSGKDKLDKKIKIIYVKTDPGSKWKSVVAYEL
ncbi:MAG: hypothetical protein ABIH00_10410 [Armatimonadota bacterium]